MPATLDVKMGRKRNPVKPDERVSVMLLRDTAEYRSWVDGLSKATLIPVTTIVRDALAQWAETRGLPAPPSGPGSAPPAPPARPKRGGKP